MPNEGLSTPDTEETLNKAISKAVSDGNMDEVDRLMAVQLPEPPDTSTETEDDKTKEEDDTGKSDDTSVADTENNDKTPAKGEEEEEDDDKKTDPPASGKDEAASKGSAASTPDKTKTTDDTDAEIADLIRSYTALGPTPVEYHTCRGAYRKSNVNYAIQSLVTT